MKGINQKIQKLIIIGSMLIASVDPTFAQVETFKGQAPATEVSTISRPIDTIAQRDFYFSDNKIHFSCDFLTGRFNNVVQKNDSVFTVIISAENYPINPSPWYAFYIVSTFDKNINVELEYVNSKHRYFPKISTDGKNWKTIDSALVNYIEPGKEKFGAGSMPQSINIHLQIKKGDSTWIAAQEIVSSKNVNEWIETLPTNKKLKKGIAAHSVYGKAIPYFSIGKMKKDKPTIVIISRQHPPEVTGYFAMKKFVAELLSKNKISKKYRKRFVTYVVPLMNPDGADYGHWRHNAGGIDLNRDWVQQNQPEVKQVNHFIDSATKKNESKILFFIDFHSTWDDIFYTNSISKPSNLPGLIDGMLQDMEIQLAQGKLNIRPSVKNESFVSKGYFYNVYNAEAITYEVGDNTSRDIIEKKGTLAAKAFLKTLFKLYKQRK